MTTDAKQIYAGSLHNTHAAETQGLTQMETQLAGLDPYPQYKALVEHHIATTRTQLGRIERALGELGSSSSAVKDGATSAAGKVGALFHRAQQDAVLKDLYAGYAFQHEQIAAYRSLAVIARAAGFGAHLAWIEETLEEEREAARAVEAIIEPVTEQYLQLTREPA